MRKESFQGHYILNKSFQSKADLRDPKTISNFKFHIQWCAWGLDCERLDECLIWLYTWCLMKNVDNRLWWCNTKNKNDEIYTILAQPRVLFLIANVDLVTILHISRYFQILLLQLIELCCNPLRCKLQVCGIQDSWFVNIHRKRGNATFQQSSATTCGVFAVFTLPHKLYGLSYSPNIFDNIGFHKTIIP